MTKNDKSAKKSAAKQFAHPVAKAVATPSAPPPAALFTEMVFILDRSGSMGGKEADTIGGFNSLIEKQKREPGKAVVSTILFDDEVKVLHDRLPIDRVPPMTGREYFARGCTALLDAVGGAIRHIGDIHKYARKEDIPDKTVFVIITDGMENASHHYTYEMIRQRIERQKERYGWEFLFLGANIDAIAAANDIGIDSFHAAEFLCYGAGIAHTFEATEKAMRSVRGGRAIVPDWADAVRADTEGKGKK